MAKNYDDLLAEQVNYLRAKKHAQRLLDEEDDEQERTELDRLSIADFVRQEDDPVTWRVDGLHVVGNNTTITAAFKVGKSTLMINLLRSLADGVPFLGQEVVKPEGRTLYWNLEVSPGQMRDWCRKVGVVNADQLLIHNLRGRRMPLYKDSTLEYVGEFMRENDVECWVIDPGARLLPGWPGAGNPENDNGVIGELCDRIDRIKEIGGVQDLWLPLHTGRAGDHARGATRWDDWTDVRWQLSTKEMGDERLRLFKAHGRDVDFSEVGLGFDPLTNRLRAEESLDGMQSTADAKCVVVALIGVEGGLSASEMRGAIKGVKTTRQGDAIALAEQRGWVRQQKLRGRVMTVLNESNEEVKEIMFNHLEQR